MNPDDIGKKEWAYVFDMMKAYIPKDNNWNIDLDNLGASTKIEPFENVGVFQFDSKNQKARLSFGAEEENPMIAEIDLQDPKATGLAVIAAFTKMVLND